MDIYTFGDLFKEWSEPICACATLILSIAVIVINRKVDAESKRAIGCRRHGFATPQNCPFITL